MLGNGFLRKVTRPAFFSLLVLIFLEYLQCAALYFSAHLIAATVMSSLRDLLLSPTYPHHSDAEWHGSPMESMLICTESSQSARLAWCNWHGHYVMNSDSTQTGLGLVRARLRRSPRLKSVQASPHRLFLVTIKKCIIQDLNLRHVQMTSFTWCTINHYTNRAFLWVKNTLIYVPLDQLGIFSCRAIRDILSHQPYHHHPTILTTHHHYYQQRPSSTCPQTHSTASTRTAAVSRSPHQETTTSSAGAGATKRKSAINSDDEGEEQKGKVRGKVKGRAKGQGRAERARRPGESIVTTTTRRW